MTRSTAVIGYLSLLFLCCPTIVQAEGLKLLTESKYFNVGAALTPTGKSAELESLERIVQEKEGDRKLLELLEAKSQIAQLYALCGLLRIKSAETTSIAKKLAAQTVEINELQGCIPVKRSVSDVVKDLINNRYAACAPAE